MKKTLTICLLLTVLIPVLLTPHNSEARIKFESTRSIQIDLEKLEISKQTFFSFVSRVIHQYPFGLQAYGQVPFKVCDIKIKGRRLIDYQTTTGRKVRFISNPSCDQLVISRLLEANYQYSPANLGSYENRKCIRSIETVFSPILEYYTILYEEKKRDVCIRCDEKERERLEKIALIQQKIVDSCKGEQDKIINFLNDLDESIEKAYQTKKTAPQ